MPGKISHITGLCRLRIHCTRSIHEGGQGTAQGITLSRGNPLSIMSGMFAGVLNGANSWSSCPTSAKAEAHGRVVMRSPNIFRNAASRMCAQHSSAFKLQLHTSFFPASRDSHTSASARAWMYCIASTTVYSLGRSGHDHGVKEVAQSPSQRKHAQHQRRLH